MATVYYHVLLSHCTFSMSDDSSLFSFFQVFIPSTDVFTLFLLIALL